MGSMSSVDNLFSCKKLKYQIIADVSKPRKTVQVNITPIFDALLESFIDFVRMWLFRKMQNIVNLRKTFFFKKVAGNAANVNHTVYHIDKVPLSFMKKETVQYVLKIVTLKRGCPKDHCLIWNYFKKCLLQY